MKKKKHGQDPFAKREAANYENPVPSREFIMQHLDEAGRPLKLAAILKAFSISGEDECEGVRRRLGAMIRDGQLIVNRRGCYALVDKMDLIKGHIQAHRDGFGFLIADDDIADIFLSAKTMRQVFSGDYVLVRSAKSTHGGKSEGTIVEVLKRNTQKIVGRYFEEAGQGFIEAYSRSIVQDIIIPKEERGAAKPKQYVTVEITAQPSKRHRATGRVIEVLGDKYTAGLEMDLSMRSYDLPYEFSKELLADLAKLPKEPVKKDYANRQDCRDLPFVTIDGENAKDFDDAVFCQSLDDGSGWRLMVAIADVSHYVSPNSLLDQEAEKRGNSVYFPARVVPMLPEALSNGLCSLKPQCDRLVMVCDMQLNSEGVLQKYEFYPAVIHSHARLTYTQAFAMLNEGVSGYKNIMPSLRAFNALFKQLLQQRKNRGAIEFETTETRIMFDSVGKISNIVPVTRNDAHRMIEEAMLLANVSAADFLLTKKVAGVFRNHEVPNPEKVENLREFLGTFGLKFSGGEKPSPKDYAKLLEKILQRSDADLLQTMLLRSLSQAVYQEHNLGHFGLGYEAYTHFTSPIRRYPDLLVHRAIKAGLKLTSEEHVSKQRMQQIAEHCSVTERRADLATRDATDWLKCEFMQEKIGNEYSGVIAEVTGFGIFVELEDIYVQGLVHITGLHNDYYTFDQAHRSLTGKKNGKVYQLGDQLKIIVARVDLDQRRIDFELVKK